MLLTRSPRVLMPLAGRGRACGVSRLGPCGGARARASHRLVVGRTQEPREPLELGHRAEVFHAARLEDSLGGAFRKYLDEPFLDVHPRAIGEAEHGLAALLDPDLLRRFTRLEQYGRSAFDDHAELLLLLQRSPLRIILEIGGIAELAGRALLVLLVVKDPRREFHRDATPPARVDDVPPLLNRVIGIGVVPPLVVPSLHEPEEVQFFLQAAPEHVLHAQGRALHAELPGLFHVHFDPDPLEDRVVPLQRALVLVAPVDLPPRHTPGVNGVQDRKDYDRECDLELKLSADGHAEHLVDPAEGHVLDLGVGLGKLVP
mmetsp:Transcript_169/g.613  ORF Transcript_169/g.613 Transcript_169/m.613 type:complete len:316 (+) Transcript_169:49-996(+)